MRKGITGLVLLCAMLNGCQYSEQRKAQAEARLQLGLALMQRNSLLAAASNLNEAERLSPGDYRIQLAQARCAQLRGDTRNAKRRYHKLLKIAPNNGLVLNNYGAFLCRLGQYEAAQQQFIAALQSSQVDARADSYDNAGYCYLEAKKFALARQAFVEAVTADVNKVFSILAESSQRFDQGHFEHSRLLLDIYQRHAPATAESLWLQIRFAASAGRSRDVKRYAVQLAQGFPQSTQYQQYLANEY